jgi:acetoin utilization protein AcuB
MDIHPAAGSARSADREAGVAEIMSRRLVAIRSDCDLRVALDTFERTALRHLVVVDPDRSCLGVLSHEQALAALDVFRRHQARVADLVPSRCPRLHRDATVRRAAAAMLLELVDALPVVDDAGRVVGIVTWSDIVALVAVPPTPDSPATRP